MKTCGEWEADLERVRSGELCFDVFAARHVLAMRRISVRYARQHALEFSDAEQEMRIAVWRAIDTYDPEYGVSLAGHVGYRVRMHLRTMARALWRSIERYPRLHPREVDHLVDPMLQPDVLIDGMRRYHRVLGTMESDAAQVVMMIADGQSIDQVLETQYTQRSYWGALKQVHRALRRASALASEI